MKSLIATFTALNVLAHSVFGCCSHHAGAHAGGASVERDGDSQSEFGHLVSMHDHDGACHRHFAPSLPDAGEQPSAPVFCDGQSSGHGSHQCPHDTCQWLVRDVAVASIVVDLITHVAANTAAPAVLASVTPVLLSREIAAAPNFAAALRLRLALGVLLI